MKFSGAVLLWIAFTLTGMRVSLSLKKRKNLIEKTIVFLGSLTLEIKYCKKDIMQIISDLSSDEILSELDFLSLCKNVMNQGEEFPDAWKYAVNNSSLYKRDEKDKLLQLGSFLGVTDTENQIKTIGIYASFFENYKNRATVDYEKYGKVSILFGMFSGAAIFILTI